MHPLRWPAELRAGSIANSQSLKRYSYGGTHIARRSDFAFVFSCRGAPPFRIWFLKGWVLSLPFYSWTFPSDLLTSFITCSRSLRVTAKRNKMQIAFSVVTFQISRHRRRTAHPLLQKRWGTLVSSNYESGILSSCAAVRQKLSENPMSHAPILAYTALLAGREINNLRIFNMREYFDSPASTMIDSQHRLGPSSPLLRRCCGPGLRSHKPDVYAACRSR